MSKLVRVKHPNGGEFTTGEHYARNKNLTVLDKDAVDQFGRVIPAKPAAQLAAPAKPETPKPSNTKPKEGSK